MQTSETFSSSSNPKLTSTDDNHRTPDVGFISGKQKKELCRQALDRLRAASSEDIPDDTTIGHRSLVSSMVTDTRQQPIPKPVFLAPNQLPVNNCKQNIDGDDGWQRKQESKALLATALEYDRIRQTRGFEEQRIAGSVFDFNCVDDSDLIDEDLAKTQWHDRELKRAQWEAVQRQRRQGEEREAEARRHMPDDERSRLDESKAHEWMERAKMETGEYKFLQRYYHKGAYFQDSDDPLVHRDYTQATGSDSGVARDTLPAVLQVRNFGKKGRSKWTHLSAEDTTAFDYGWGDKKNPVNYEPVSRMGGMRGDLDNPSLSSKRRRPPCQ